RKDRFPARPALTCIIPRFSPAEQPLFPQKPGRFLQEAPRLLTVGPFPATIAKVSHHTYRERGCRMAALCRKCLSFFKKEVVLCVAALLAAASCFLSPPSAAYLTYIDWNTLALLFGLMAV